MARRNLTLQLDEELLHRARVLAARRGMSVSGLVGQELRRLVEDEDRYEEARRQALQALSSARLRGGRRWRREDLYRP